MTTFPDEYLLVFEDDGATWLAASNERHQLDTAVTAYLETGRDSLLHLDLIDGSPLVLKASLVTGWRLETKETREINQKQFEEQRQINGDRHPWESD